MVAVERGTWRKEPVRNMNIKPARPWVTNAAKIDNLPDELDALGMEDSGLFAATVAKRRR
jgi:hypothetical protein